MFQTLNQFKLKVFLRMCKREKGSALIAVFWVIAVLSLSLVGVLKVVTFDTELVESQVHGKRAVQMAEMGIELAFHPQIRPNDPLLNQTFPERNEGFMVNKTTENKKINLNGLLLQVASSGDFSALPKSEARELADGIFSSMGFEEEESEFILAAMIDWIDGDELYIDANGNGAERDWYEEQGYEGLPYNQPFRSLDEVNLVRGADLLNSRFPRWREWFTVFTNINNNRGGNNNQAQSSFRVDLNSASEEIILAMFETDLGSAIPDGTDYFFELLLGGDGVRNTEDDQPFNTLEEAYGALGIVDINFRTNFFELLNPGDGNQNGTLRIESTGWSGDARRQVIAIFAGGSGGNPRTNLIDRKEIIVE